MENNNQTNTSKKNNPTVLIILVILIIAIVGYGVWQSVGKKDDKQNETTTVSTTFETTTPTTESTTQATTTTTTTTSTTKETTTKSKYLLILPDTIWTCYTEQTNQYKFIEFVDGALHYWEEDASTSVINESMWADYDIKGDELIVTSSGENKTEKYKISFVISDMNNLRGADCIKISGNGTIKSAEYYYG